MSLQFQGAVRKVKVSSAAVTLPVQLLDLLSKIRKHLCIRLSRLSEEKKTHGQNGEVFKLYLATEVGLILD